MARHCIPLAACLMLAAQSAALAGARTQAAKEAAEYVLKKFGKEVAEEGVETLTRKIEVLAVKHGDEAIEAVRKIGPRALHIVDDAAEHAPQAVKLMARYGDEAVWVAADRGRLALFAKYGDEAAEAMIKHGAVAESLIQTAGKSAAGAFSALTKQGGRRLAMMAEDGTLNAIGRTDELLGVVGRFGDRAMDFIWKNKGALAVGAALTAFLADPQPFIDRTADITKVVADNMGPPIAAVAGEAAKRTNWTRVMSILALIGGGVLGIKYLTGWRLRRPRLTR